MSKQTIDLSMSWQQAAEIMIRVLENGTPEGKKAAREELRNMAKVADLNAEIAFLNLQELTEDKLSSIISKIKSL